MKAKDVVRYQPWLRFCNIHNISDRLLQESNNNAFVVFNTLYDRYEVHTVDAFLANGESTNAVVEDLNQFLIKDFRANDIRKYKEDIESRREYNNQVYEKHEEQRLDSLINLGLKRVENLLGRDL